MSSFLFDLRLAVRRLVAKRGATLVAIVTLSVGIGAVSTMYVLFGAGTDDLPRVPGVDRIGRVLVVNPAQLETRIPPADAERRAWLHAPPRGITLSEVDDVEVAIDPGAHILRAQRVSAAFFDLAAVQPEMGRRFASAERALIVSRRFWDLLPPDLHRLGTLLNVDGEPYSLVGVMPATFWMPSRGVDAWLPRDRTTQAASTYVLARLDATITVEEAGAALTPAVQQLRGSHHAARVALLADDAAVRYRTGVLMLIGPALLVLLAVCANVAGLLLGDVHRRRQELAVRAALGASRWRLAREVFADALVLAVLGGAVSLVGAYWSVRALRAAFATVSPEWAAMLPSFSVVAPIAFGASIVAVLGVGYTPALFASRVRIVNDLAGTGAPLFRRGRYGAADLLLVLQIAMAAGLVLWTATFANVFRQVFEVAPYVPADRVWKIPAKLRSTGTLSPQVHRLLLARAAMAPGIETAGVTEAPGARRAWTGRSRTGAVAVCSASLERFSGAYFEAYRFPTRGVRADAGEAMLNEVARRRCGDPVEIREAATSGTTLRVVGSVDDRWFATAIPGPARGPATIYVPLTTVAGAELLLTVRSRSTSAGDVRALREDLVRALPDWTFAEPETLARERERNLGVAVLLGRLLGALTGICLLLGIVGLHAAIAQAVTARTREIGVRIALGAAPRNIVAMTVGHHAAPAVLGILLGAGVTVAALAMLGTDDAGMIREMAMATASLPRWWAALAGLLLVSALLSATFPVLRALRVSPAEVLRRE